MTHESETGLRKLRVAVLMGGSSNERAVSLSTGKMIAESLDTTQYQVTTIDTRDMLALTASVAAKLPSNASKKDEKSEGILTTIDEYSAYSLKSVEKSENASPDVVFIALHGKGGEDGTIQGALELMGIPYTGSGVLASALAMNKRMAKQLFRSHGIPVIDELVIQRGKAPSDEMLLEQAIRVFGESALFVKPSSEGSTFGCSLVLERGELPQAVEFALQYDEFVLIERYVKGMEITVGVLEDPDAEEGLLALPVVEIIPKNAYYDYESKYAPDGSKHIIPARISAAQTALAQEYAKRCHTALGCRGMSRTDLIATDTALYVLEVNTIPGMTPTSLLPQAAEVAGISFPELLNRLILSALR